jgi:hypothetical protein
VKASERAWEATTSLRATDTQDHTANKSVSDVIHPQALALNAALLTSPWQLSASLIPTKTLAKDLAQKPAILKTQLMTPHTDLGSYSPANFHPNTPVLLDRQTLRLADTCVIIGKTENILLFCNITSNN